MRSQEFFIKNSKGLGLSTVIEKPTKDKDGRFVILLHGFTGWKEEKHISSFAELLAENGIGSVCFDASGSGKSEGSFYYDYRLTNYINDLESVYEYLKSANFVDNNRIGLWSHSYGSQIMTWFANSHPEVKALCFCQGTIRVQGKAHLESVRKLWKMQGYRVFETETMGEVTLPYEFYGERQQFDGYKVLKNLKMPKLFIAGTEDNLVPQASVKEAFEKATEPKEYYNCEKADHFYKNNPKKLKEINELTLKFFQNHL